MLAKPIFPCSHPQSIVGTNELNFCVRNGNRWTLVVIVTNYIRSPSLSSSENCFIISVRFALVKRLFLW